MLLLIKRSFLIITNSNKSSNLDCGCLLIRLRISREYYIRVVLTDFFVPNFLAFLRTKTRKDIILALIVSRAQVSKSSQKSRAFRSSVIRVKSWTVLSLTYLKEQVLKVKQCCKCTTLYSKRVQGRLRYSWELRWIFKLNPVTRYRKIKFYSRITPSNRNSFFFHPM